METIFVERSFPAPVRFEELQALEDAFAWCLEQNEVQFLYSYVSVDRTAAICVYRAPDAESVRRVQRQANIPLDLAWTGELVVGGDARAAPPGAKTVVVQRELPEPVTRDAVAEAYRSLEERGSFALHGVAPIAAYLSRDGRRLACMFAGPDAETVMRCNRELGLPTSRVYPADYLPSAHRV